MYEEIIDFIDRLFDGVSDEYADGDISADTFNLASTLLLRIKAVINSYQQPSEDLDKAAKEYVLPMLDKTYEQYGERKMMELSEFNGYDVMQAYEDGAQRGGEQMIPVTALVNESKDFLSLSLSTEEYAKIGRRFKGGDDVEIYIKQDKK